VTGWVAVGIALGLALILLGLQHLTRTLRSTPMDTLHPGPLIQRPDATATAAPPPSLSLTEQLVEDATFSNAVAHHRLWPLVARLARERGVTARDLRPPDADTRAWLADMIQVLEKAR